MNRLIGLIGTLIVHVALLLLYLWEKKPVQPPPPPSSRVVAVQLLPQSAFNLPLKPTKDGEEVAGILDPNVCGEKSKSYRGVGVLYNIFTMVVIEAPPNYPAYKAGIRVDDEIISKTGPDGSGWVEYGVLRDKEELKFKIQQEDICFEEEEPSGS